MSPEAKWARWTYAVETARVTGRVIFGQLWMPDCTFDDAVKAVWFSKIEAQLNTPSPLLMAIRGQR